MIKGFLIGFVLAAFVLAGGFYFYFAEGMAPVAAADPPMPFERKLANMALDAHIPADYAATMYPKPPQLFRGKGVTDAPASESYWKTANGIRLSGMPSFKSKLSDTQLWQVTQLVAHANEIPETVKKVLVRDVSASESATPLTAAPVRKSIQKE